VFKSMLLKRVLGEMRRLENAMKKRRKGNSLNLVCENEAIDLPLIQ
jgi:hypothetical protein